MSTTLEGISHEIKELPNCRRALYVKVSPDIVSTHRDRVSESFAKMARVPGYRPGKAPKAMVIKRFKKQIDEELQHKVVGGTVEDIVKKEGLRVMVFGDVEDIEFNQDGSFSYKVVVVVRPEFDLPEYKGLPIKQVPEEVSEDEVTSALDRIRERMAEFKEAPEGSELGQGDYAVLQYKGTMEGEPVSQKLGVDRLSYWDSNDQFWIEVGSPYEKEFFPGLAEHIIGMKKGDARSVTITYPEDFQEEGLRGQTVDFEITLKEITSRVLPELSDELAVRMMGEDSTLEKLTEQIKEDLKANKKNQNMRLGRTQAARALSSQVDFEVPEHQVAHETKRIAEQMVQQQLRSGVSEDVLEENQAALVSAASGLAASNVKERYLLVKLADKEGIKVSHDEIVDYLTAIAPQYRMTPEQLHKRVHANGAEARIEEDLLIGKALDFLVANATVTIDENAAADEEGLHDHDHGHDHEHGHECGPDCDHEHHDHAHAELGEDSESSAEPKA